MPAKSKAQQRLFQAAAHGADFAMAAKLRASMPVAKMREFETGLMAGKPVQVGHPHKNLGAYLHKAKAK